MRPPRKDDLTPWALRQMEAAYQRRERPQCSREDFFDGFLAALRVLRSRSSFRPGHFEPEEGSDGVAAVAQGE